MVIYLIDMPCMQQYSYVWKRKGQTIGINLLGNVVLILISTQQLAYSVGKGARSYKNAFLYMKAF